MSFMSDKILRPVVICSTFVEKQGKFLMVFCPKFREWRVPGGRVDGEESLEETVKREMNEGLGIEIKEPIFLGWGQDSDHNYNRGRKVPRLLMFFHAKTDEGLTIDPTEAEEHKWVTLDEMRSEENKEGGLKDFFERNLDLKLS